jgi:uncharacterized membrane protein YeaQ/YmgE (transglycosylase-associated protein family)
LPPARVDNATAANGNAINAVIGAAILLTVIGFFRK